MNQGFKDLPKIDIYSNFSLEKHIRIDGESEAIEWLSDFPEINCTESEYGSRYISYLDGKYYSIVMKYYINNQRKNVVYKSFKREMYVYPRVLFPNEEIFKFPLEEH